MIAQLRAVHRVSWLVIFPIVAATLIWAVRNRSAPPPAQTLPPYMSTLTAKDYQPRWQGQQDGLALTVYDANPPLLTIELLDPPAVPDPLIYWSARAVSQKVPGAEAVLIGELGSEGRRTYQLPAEAYSSMGYLCIFSPARGSIATVIPLGDSAGGDQ